ncbi:MAG: HYR domain-containing protein, partial [Bacteroidota bacterium]
VTVEETFNNAPDLTITNASLPDNLQANQSYNLQINLQNIGNEVINQLFATTAFISNDDRLDATDIRIGSLQAQYLAVGAYDVSMPIRLLENSIGNYHIFIKADADEVVEELNENNNVYHIPVFIGATNTLTVFCPDDITLEEESPSDQENEGDYASVRLVVPAVFSTCELQGFDVELLNAENFTPLLDGSYIAQGAGIYEVKYKISDECGNEAFCSYTITITVPEIVHQFTFCPNDIIVNTSSGNDGTIVDYEEPIFQSNCPGDTKIIIQPEDAISGSFFPIGTTEVRYIADNFNCDVELCAFTVTVRAGNLLNTSVESEATAFYPNPSNGKINIQHLKTYDSYKVIDSQGNILIYKENIRHNDIDISQLINGIYFIELEKKEKLKKLKIIKIE